MKHIIMLEVDDVEYKSITQVIAPENILALGKTTDANYTKLKSDLDLLCGVYKRLRTRKPAA